MADLVIRGMEMPKSCFDCIFENRFFGKIGCNNLPGMFANELHAIAYTTERNPFCPLVPFPKGHGRLIDADALIDALETQDYSCAPDTLEDWTPQDMTVAEIADITHAPTIVPAEGGTEDGNS